ncbi:MAG: GNAT family N-acetyltransferase [Betaproteobacteria bacterium]|nr:GNAT family N-acetyltransferase [Betaproteobacteria bacterium]
MSQCSIDVCLVSWAEAAPALARVRRAVFIVEQRIPEAEEWDAADAVSLHALARTSVDAPVGTGRLLPGARIGRLAVLRPYRGQGIGRAILRALMNAAAGRGDTHVLLHAQLSATGFYAREGFVAFGPVFEEVGIPHQAMRCDLGRG